MSEREATVPAPSDRESDTRCDTAAPSDEAVEAATNDLLGRNDDGRGHHGTHEIISNPTIAEHAARRALTAAYALDMPRREAEVRAEERAATTAQLDTAREALRDLLRVQGLHPLDFGVQQAMSHARNVLTALDDAHFNPEAER